MTAVALLACGSNETEATPATAAAPNMPGTAGTGGESAAPGAPGSPGAGVSPSGNSNEMVAVGGLNGAAGDSSGSGSAADAGSPITGAMPVPLIPGTEGYDCSPPTGTLPALQLAPYVTGLNNPVFVTHAPGETERLFVLEQEGRIRVVRNGTLNPAPFIDLSERVELLTWEQGLLGLAFHPQYAQNGLFYVHYNGAAGAAVIAELRVSGEADVADASSERVLLTVPTVDGYHNGGSINFGPDSLLYIGLGDGGGLGAAAGPSRLNAQDVTSLRGGMLRISPVAAGMQPYTSPTGNLVDVNPQALPELWSKGLRNPYRSNFDPCTGALYIGDVGDRSWEEVNVEPPATGHRNYGWPILEGDECFGGAAAAGCDRTGLTPPVHAHPSANTGGPQFQAVIGGSVYRGRAIPALRGTYFFSDLYGNTRTFRYDVASDTISEVVSLESDLNPAENDQGLVAIQNGGDGELYFVSRGSSGGGGAFAPQEPIGTIYRLQVE